MPRIAPITDDAIAEAAALLRRGALVGFPTETVYGLGGDATDEQAVARIFAAKGRPHFNPLIVHVASVEAACRLAEFDARAMEVAERLWPGPLSLVLPKRVDCGLSMLASAGLSTVALRFPSHPQARRLLEAVGRPVAAPSANASGRLSPTTAEHVRDSLGEAVSLILDGGSCAVGLESTVLDLSRPDPVLLRPGGVTAEELEAVLGAPLTVAGSDDSAPSSPGMLSSHYAPSCPLRMNARAAGPGEALLAFGAGYQGTANLSERGDLVQAAANLFVALHRLDQEGHAGIAVTPIPEVGLGRAINDRLRRAAAPRR